MFNRMMMGGLAAVDPPAEYLFDELTNIPAFAVGFRILNVDYEDSDLVLVRRSTDDTTSGFTATEILDGTLESFCGAGDGFVHTMYNQGSLGASGNLIQATAAAQMQIVDDGVLLVTPTNAAKMLVPAAATCGYATGAFAQYTGNYASAVSCFAMASNASTHQSVGLTTTTQSDSAAVTRASLIRQNITNQSVRNMRNSVTYSVNNIVYGTPYSISSRIAAGATHLVGGSAGSPDTDAMTDAAFDITRVLVGAQASGSLASYPGTYHCEHLVWLADCGATDAATVRASQLDYYIEGTPMLMGLTFEGEIVTHDGEIVEDT
jgi:hypothetical protein